MRTRKRIHPYVAPDLAKRLAAYCATRGVTESAAVESAIENHLSGIEKDNDVILRRLDRLGRASARQQRDLEVLSEAFAVFVRYWVGVREVRLLVDTGQLPGARVGPRKVIRISKLALLSLLKVREAI